MIKYDFSCLSVFCPFVWIKKIAPEWKVVQSFGAKSWNFQKEEVYKCRLSSLKVRLKMQKIRRKNRRVEWGTVVSKELYYEKHDCINKLVVSSFSIGAQTVS